MVDPFGDKRGRFDPDRLLKRLEALKGKADLGWPDEQANVAPAEETAGSHESGQAFEETAKTLMETN